MHLIFFILKIVEFFKLQILKIVFIGLFSILRIKILNLIEFLWAKALTVRILLRLFTILNQIWGLIENLINLKWVKIFRLAYQILKIFFILINQFNLILEINYFLLNFIDLTISLLFQIDFFLLKSFLEILELDLFI